MRTIDWFYITEARQLALKLILRVVAPLIAGVGGWLVVTRPPVGLVVLGIVAVFMAWVAWEARP